MEYQVFLTSVSLKVIRWNAESQILYKQAQELIEKFELSGAPKSAKELTTIADKLARAKALTDIVDELTPLMEKANDTVFPNQERIRIPED